MRDGSEGTTNAVTVKKGQAPYNFVTRDEAKTLAEGIKSANNYTGITASKLCSSYAWDTALTFIDKTVSNYSTNSTQGNYYDLSFTYKDMSGTTQTKAANTGTLIPTGATTAVCNIYDMGGNVYEWTTEAYSYPDHPSVIRGGNFSITSSEFPAGYRGTL
ncbi:MAG TPA: SUMF1/EgtB/PvdO family nonheme iron enzyme, partial [Spirochaetia bacterium]|nr:SUMF1/EgtB/PvdO family nonheme iron enzyme [Spirochaetia bacterium]